MYGGLKQSPTYQYLAYPFSLYTALARIPQTVPTRFAVGTAPGFRTTQVRSGGACQKDMVWCASTGTSLLLRIPWRRWEVATISFRVAQIF